MSADSHDQLNCALIWAILKPQGAVSVVRGGNTADCLSFGWQEDISSSGLATKTLIFFIWEQIMQQSDKSIKQLSIPMYISLCMNMLVINLLNETQYCK